MSANALVSTQGPTSGAISHRYRRHRELLPEANFRHSLYRERQRSERSGNSVLLALLQLGESRWSSRDARLTLSELVCSVIRATDTVGWYEDNKTLGVIFTELRDPSKSTQLNSIEARLKRALCTTSMPELAEEIRVIYHVFPEKDGGSGRVDPIFYQQSAADTRKVACILKRCMDVVGSLLALTALLPLLLLVALAVKLTSEGPVLCRQTRLGAGGRTFTFLKFRTMFQNSDPSLHRDYVTRMIAGQDVAQVHRGDAGIYKIVDDPRITPIGRILRRTSLDELPQFFNVLKGDMSMVGPRPPLPYEFECYSAWHRRRVLEGKPGLTGLWQVYGRSRTNFDDMVRLDLQYAQEWSLWLDLKILLKTPVAVIAGAGAY